ncbi:MAG: hypothetical protein PHI98_03925 [Eubacteriales bacterium]|nr:hypothetical protein [Eubacteriales bacterium]
MFPPNADIGRKEDNLGIALLGNRIYCDQTLVEYLIEFLLVFTSAKNADGDGRLRFHSASEISINRMTYHVAPNTALRRFIFYNNSKQESRSTIDTKANAELWKCLRDTTQNGEEDIDLIHDLLHSYAIVTRNRGWYAQALLPVAPELLLTDLQGIKKRQKADWPLFDPQVDNGFDFDKHNFLARGGQVLYLHLLQGLLHSDEQEKDDREVIEKLLRNMLRCSGGEVGLLANFVQNEWEYHREDVDFRLRAFNMGYIQDAFDIRSARFVQEIRCFLSCDIHPIARIELLSQGLILALLRAIQIVAAHKIDPSGREPLWVMDMSEMGGTSNIAKLAAASYATAYDSFLSAMSILFDERSFDGDKRFEMLQKSKQNTADVFKNLGKEMKLVIPPRGGHERFSLSEALARYLVLAIVKPGRKITLDTFLDRLYDHYRIIIAPAQYRRAIADGSWKDSENMADYFEINARCFQDFLKQCGFVRDLSDATAIVENPYKEVTLE